MYTPAHFAEKDLARCWEMVRGNPLGTLVTYGEEGFEATHVPFLVEDGRLVGHVARANPIWKRAGSRVLVVFLGEQHYISPGWYASKARDPRVVPTWNYVAVHMQGVLSAFEDADRLRGVVAALTREHEAGMAEPWSIEDAPAEYIDKLLGAIVGIEIAVDDVVGKWKVSQNRPVEDRESVRERLGDDPMARWIR